MPTGDHGVPTPVYQRSSCPHAPNVREAHLLQPCGPTGLRGAAHPHGCWRSSSSVVGRRGASGVAWEADALPTELRPRACPESSRRTLHGSLTRRAVHSGAMRRLALAAARHRSRARPARCAGGATGRCRRLRGPRHVGRHLRRTRVPQPCSRRRRGSRPAGCARSTSRPRTTAAPSTSSTRSSSALFVDALQKRGDPRRRVVPARASSSRRVDVRRTRAMLSFRTPKGSSFDGVALDIESLRLKSAGLRTTAPPGAEPDPARRGGGDADRGDHLPVARLRAAPDLVARLPVGRS